MKRTIIIAVLLFAVLLSNSQTNWQNISNQGGTYISFPSLETGYSVGSSLTGVMRKTTNGGSAWSLVSGGNFVACLFINDNIGWRVGYPGYIGKTTNGGGSFVQQPTGVNDVLNDIFFINDTVGWVVGGDFSQERIFKTTNGGLNWVSQTSGTSGKLFSVFFVNPTTGWAVGSASSPKILKTTNGGQNWFSQLSPATTPLYSVHFANENVGYAVAGYMGGETIIKTTNGGTTWVAQTSNDTRYLRECFVFNKNTGIAVGQSGKIIRTTDGGTNWNVVPSGTTSELWSVDFVNDLTGYAVGTNVVLKTTNGGVGFFEEITEERPVLKIFPNPVVSSATIGFNLNETGHVLIKIHNIYGKEVKTIVNNIQYSHGNYKIEINSTRIPAGVYIINLIVNSRLVDSKKLTIID